MKSEKDQETSQQTPEAEYAHATIAATSVSLINSTLGSGMLGIPLAYAKAGLFPAILIHVVMAIVSFFSYYYLLYASDATQTFSLGELGSVLYGASGIFFVDIVNMIYCFGSLWSYLILDVDFIMSLIRAAGVDEDSVFVKRWFLALVLSTFILQPLSWFRSFNSLRFTSFLGTFAMSICVIVIVIRYFWQDDDAVPRGDSPEFVHKSFSIIQSFSTLTFAFSCQQNVPLCQGEIKKRSIKSMILVSLISITGIASFYMVAGVFGYISFTSSFFDADGSGNILKMYGDKDPLAIVARIASLLTVTFCFPMNSLPSRVALINCANAVKTMYANYKQKKSLEAVPILDESEDRPAFTSGQEEEEDDDDSNNSPVEETRSTEVSLLTNDHSLKGFVISCLIGSGLTYLAMVLSIFLSEVNLVFDLIGSTAGVAVGFVYPVMFYLRIRHHPSKYVNRVRYFDPNFPEMEQENEERLEELLRERSKHTSNSSIQSEDDIPTRPAFHRVTSQILKSTTSKVLIPHPESRLVVSKSQIHLRHHRRNQSRASFSGSFYQNQQASGKRKKKTKKRPPKYPHRAPFTWQDALSYVVAVFGVICGMFSLAMAIIFDTDLGDNIDI